jgi:hypothetical protein
MGAIYVQADPPFTHPEQVMDFRGLWDAGRSITDFVAAAAPRYRALWEGIYRAARVPDWALLPPVEERRLLALSEDWCIDASSTLPVLARWCESVPGLSLRILNRDEHPEVMDRYLTNGSRSIPVVILLDAEHNELGHWGPYPAPLADWVRTHKPPALPKDEFVKGKRTWYARDRGETMIREMMALLEEPTGGRSAGRMAPTL